MCKRYAGFGLQDRQQRVRRGKLIQIRFFLLTQPAALHSLRELGISSLFLGGEVERENVSRVFVRKAAHLGLDNPLKN